MNTDITITGDRIESVEIGEYFVTITLKDGACIRVRADVAYELAFLTVDSDSPDLNYVALKSRKSA